MIQISLLPKTKIITINETSEMKKLNPAFLFIITMFSYTFVSNAQYKLRIGNFWVYSGDNQEWKISIIDTATLFDSVLYYEIYEQREWLPKSNCSIQDNGDTNQYFIRQRTDDLFEEVIVYNAIDDTVIQPYVYKYNAQLGDKWIYRIDIDNIDSTDIDTIWAEVVDVFEGYQFGEWRTIKKITYWTGLTDFSKYFCDDFGELSEENYLGVVSWLKGCFIDSVAYGDTSFIPVGVQDNANEASKFLLMQNYPNPFNPETIISYTIPYSTNVQVVVYDVVGKEITTLVDKYQKRGDYKIVFNPLANGLDITSGIYFYTLRTGNFVQTKKMVYLR